MKRNLSAHIFDASVVSSNPVDGNRSEGVRAQNRALQLRAAVH